MRHYQPQRSPGMSGNTLNLQRNKRSIVLDLKRAECRSALHRLIETADVFVHSLRPGAIERLGFGYEQVRAVKPDIIYCGAYGFSANGPYSDKAAYDDLIQAGSGIAGAVRATARRADLRPHRDLRQAHGPGHRLCDPGGAVASRARRGRAGCRSADAGDYGGLQLRRAHGRVRVRAAARQSPASRA